MSTYNYDQQQQPGSGGYYDSDGDDYSSYMDVYSSSPSTFATSSASASPSTPRTTLASPVGQSSSAGQPGEDVLGWSDMGTNVAGLLQPQQWQYSAGSQQPQLASARTFNGLDLSSGSGDASRALASGQSGDKRSSQVSSRQSDIRARPGESSSQASSVSAPQVPSSTTTPAPEYVMINPTQRNSATELNDQDE